MAKWRSGSIFIILRILVWGNCVSLVRWSSSWIAGFSSICEPTSVISVRDSTVSAILNMKLAGKVGWFQSTRSWKEACRRALRRRAKGRTNQVHGWSTTKSFNLFHNFRSKCVLLSELYNSVYESWVWPECNCDRKIIHHSNSELNWHVSFNLKEEYRRVFSIEYLTIMGQTLKEGINQGFWRLHVIRRAFSWSVPVFSEVVSFCNNTFFVGVASVVNGFYHLRPKEYWHKLSTRVSYVMCRILVILIKKHDLISSDS